MCLSYALVCRLILASGFVIERDAYSLPKDDSIWNCLKYDIYFCQWDAPVGARHCRALNLLGIEN